MLFRSLGNICFMLFSICTKASELVEETGEGSILKADGDTFTLSSLMVFLMYAITSEEVSPGNILELMTAFADAGNTLSFIPLRKMVGASVVLILAFPELDPSYKRVIKPLNNHWFAKTIFWMKGISGPTYSRKYFTGSHILEGI